MRTTFWTETKVGIFVILGAVILAIGTSLVGKFRWGKAEGYTVTAVFGSISGLEEKAAVRIAGVRVGEVEKIWLKDGLAYVRMRLAPEAVIRADSEVTVSSLGLLGEKYVEISSGTLQKPKVESGQTVHGKDVVSMDRLIEEFTDIAVDIKAVTASLRTFLGPEDQGSPLRKLLTDFDGMVLNIDRLIGDNREGIGRAVDNLSSFARRADQAIADNEGDFRATLQNFRQLSENLKSQVDGLGEKLDRISGSVETSVEGARKDFGESMEEIKRTAARIDQTFASLQSVVDKAKAGEGTVGKLLTDETAYDNLNRAATSISQVAERIDRGEGTIGKLVTDDAAYNSMKDTLDSVGRFIKRGEDIKLRVGFSTEYLFDPGDVKSHFSLRINPREDKFYLIEAVDDPRGRLRTTETLTWTSTDGGVPVSVIENKEETDDDLKFTFLFGRRFEDLTLKGGLIESSGGVGAEYWFHNDRGRLSFDAFDFDRAEMDPHVTLGVSYAVYKDVFLSAGVDDIFEKDRRSFYLGAGLSFADDDLKYLLSLTSGSIP